MKHPRRVFIKLCWSLDQVNKGAKGSKEVVKMLKRLKRLLDAI